MDEKETNKENDSDTSARSNMHFTFPLSSGQTDLPLCSTFMLLYCSIFWIICEKKVVGLHLCTIRVTEGQFDLEDTGCVQNYVEDGTVYVSWIKQPSGISTNHICLHFLKCVLIWLRH